MIDEIDQTMLPAERISDDEQQPLSGIACALIGIGFLAVLAAAIIGVRVLG